MTSAARSSDGFHAAELQDQIHGAFVADAGRAGNVVDRVAAQGHDVDDLLRRDAQCFLYLGGIENQVVFLRVEDLYVVVTSCIMSLSPETMKTSCLVRRLRGRVPITSSASKPSASRMGMRRASRARRM